MFVQSLLVIEGFFSANPRYHLAIFIELFVAPDDLINAKPKGAGILVPPSYRFLA